MFSSGTTKTRQPPAACCMALADGPERGLLRPAFICRETVSFREENKASTTGKLEQTGRRYAPFPIVRAVRRSFWNCAPRSLVDRLILGNDAGITICFVALPTPLTVSEVDVELTPCVMIFLCAYAS